MEEYIQTHASVIREKDKQDFEVYVKESHPIQTLPAESHSKAQRASEAA